MAILPDGRRAVSASWDKTLIVWDLESGERLRTLEGHTHAVFFVAALPDGRRAVSASDDCTLIVWDLDTGEPLHSLEEHTGYIRSVAVLPGGRRAVSASGDRFLIVWDLESGERLAAFGADAGFNACAVAPNGRAVLPAIIVGASTFYGWRGWDDAVRTNR